MSGMFVKGYLGQNLINWLIDTGAGTNIMSYKKYEQLPESHKFALQEDSFGN